MALMVRGERRLAWHCSTKCSFPVTHQHWSNGTSQEMVADDPGAAPAGSNGGDQSVQWLTHTTQLDCEQELVC